MIFFWLIVYNFIVIPVAYLILPVWALFDEKLRQGLEGRKHSWLALTQFRERHPAQPLYIVHSASLGEFEQAKPVIRGLKALRPDILIIATFTSPSGFHHAARIPEVDLFSYLPLDTYMRTRSFIQRLRPQKLIFVTYELWPNLIFNARRHHVTTYLISARIRPHSSKTKPIINAFFCDLYRMMDYIYAISDEHKASLQKLVGSVNIKVLTLGDTRYDQVIQRSQELLKKTQQPLFAEGFVLIAGSVWPQDVRHLVPALGRVLERFPEVRVIIAPHEPNAYALEMLEDQFQQQGYQCRRFSTLIQPETVSRIILVDRVGLLAELYHQAKIAFVGGSFRGSIHNVMEPAVAGLPVLFGPTYHNSHEAELLIQAGGGFCCPDAEALYKTMASLIHDAVRYQQAAESARQVILANMGASARTVKEILESE